MLESTLVLCATPLSALTRNRLRTEIEGHVEFVDLATLRRGGLRVAFRRLRSVRNGRIRIVGDRDALRLFGDLLRILALVAPSPVREEAVADGAVRPLSRFRGPLILARILSNSLLGLACVLVNSLTCRLLLARSAPALRARKPLRRCLYLRPTLMLGPQVGGSIGHVAGVANALHRKSVQVRLLTVSDLPTLLPAVSQVIVPPQFSAAFPNEVNQHRYHRKFFQVARRHAIGSDADFIYQRYSMNDLSGVRMRARRPVPLIVEFNGSEVWVQQHWGRPLRFRRTAERIEMANLRWADLVVVVSDELRKQLLKEGISPDKVLFYPNCVDVTMFNPSRFDGESRAGTRDVLGVPRDADLFTFIGTFGRWHGTEVLAAAIRILVNARIAWLEARRIHFLLVGDGPFAPAAHEALAPEPYARFVTFAGVRPQLETPSILAASDVLLSPHVPNPDGSVFFGSPTKLFEYMAMERLIVASDLDQIGWVLRGWKPGMPPPEISSRIGAAAVLTNPGDSVSLAEGIAAAAEMCPAERQRYAALAKGFVVDAFSWDKNVDAFLRALDQVLTSDG